MRLTKIDINKIREAWGYQAATSCGWAMGELSKYVGVVLKKGQVDIEDYPEPINDLFSFLKWKRLPKGLPEVPILRNLTKDRLIEIFHELIEYLKINQINFKSYDVNNNYFILQFIGENGDFMLDVGKISFRGQLKNKVHKIDLRLIGDKIFKLNYEVYQENSFFKNTKTTLKTIEFKEFEIR